MIHWQNESVSGRHVSNEQIQLNNNFKNDWTIGVFRYPIFSNFILVFFKKLRCVIHIVNCTNHKSILFLVLTYVYTSKTTTQIKIELSHHS